MLWIYFITSYQMTLLQTYTDKHMNKIRIIQQLIDWKVSLEQAMEYLSCSDRTVYRYKSTLIHEWPPWFIHWLKDRPSNNRYQKRKLDHLKEKAQKKIYEWFWPTFLAEKLSEEYWYEINHETLRLAMIRRWLRTVNKQSIKITRSCRERRPTYWMLMQFDWSYHDRFENWDSVCLLCAIDDATSQVTHMKFTQWESLENIADFRKEYMISRWKPWMIYIDCHATYKVNHPNDQFTYEMKTRFHKALSKLWVKLIFAKSPQWKWRVERWFGTHQDRLVKELRLAWIKTIEQANVFLGEYYIPKHNNKFAVSAKDEWNKHTQLTHNEIESFDLLFAKECERTVKHDWTVHYKSIVYQLPKWTLLRRWRKIIVKETINWTIWMFIWDRKLPYTLRYSKK